MAKRVQFIRHLVAAADAFVGRVGEITVNLTNNALRVHDGASAGGHEHALADASNLQAATAAQDGKMTAAKFSEVAQNTSDITAHVGAGGAAHAEVGGAAGFMSVSDKSKLDGIEPGAMVNWDASEILALLLTVDGAGSNLDADLLDGAGPAESAAASSIAKRDANGVLSGATPTAAGHLTTKSYVDGADNTLDTNKVNKSTTITAGAGLLGGGDLSANRTLSVNAGGFSEITVDDPEADFIIIQDISDAGATRKIKPKNVHTPAIKQGTVYDGTDADTTHDFTSPFPNPKGFAISYAGVDFTANDFLFAQLGTAGGIETDAVYDSRLAQETGSASGVGLSDTVQMAVCPSNGVGQNGITHFKLIDPATNTWVASGVGGHSATIGYVRATVALDGALTTVRIKGRGDQTFAAGLINIEWYY